MVLLPEIVIVCYFSMLFFVRHCISAVCPFSNVNAVTAALTMYPLHNIWKPLRWESPELLTLLPRAIWNVGDFLYCHPWVCFGVFRLFLFCFVFHLYLLSYFLFFESHTYPKKKPLGLFPKPFFIFFLILLLPIILCSFSLNLRDWVDPVKVKIGRF